MTPTPARPLLRLLLASSLAVTLLGSLTACAPLIVGGAAATTAVVAADRRTAGEQVEDQAIELKVASEVRNILGDKGRVTAVSYGGKVLLVGDAPNQHTRLQAQQAASKVQKVTQVVNELRVGDITPLSVRTNDSWLTTKVMTTLINTKDVPTRTIIVTTERGVVYLMGRLTEDESERTGKAASSVTGVNKVVKLFQIISPESLTTGTSASTASPPAAPAPGTLPDTGSPDVHAMPVK